VSHFILARGGLDDFASVRESVEQGGGHLGVAEHGAPFAEGQDRGAELANHSQFTVATDMKVYFCDPASPWQRGSNENTNGLLRQYYPKGADISDVSQAQLDTVARKLNARPRETLHWKAPAYILSTSVSMIHRAEVTHVPESTENAVWITRESRPFHFDLRRRRIVIKANSGGPSNILAAGTVRLYCASQGHTHR
jgi:hypothetical protein